MARIVVIYKTPKDAAAFDRYYFGTHVPLVKRIPGLRKFEVSQGMVTAPSGPSGVHRVTTMHFDDMAAFLEAFSSAEGQAAAADAETLMGDGDQMLLFESREI